MVQADQEYLLVLYHRVVQAYHQDLVRRVGRLDPVVLLVQVRKLCNRVLLLRGKNKKCHQDLACQVDLVDHLHL